MRCDPAMDQAEGLRRLLEINHQAFTVLAARADVGRTRLIINVAAALAHSGKCVLVLDENPAPNNLLDYTGLLARHDLLDVAQGKCPLSQAVQTALGFSILPTARAMQAKLGSACLQRMENALFEATDSADVVLVDAMLPDYASVSPGLSTALLVMIEATPGGITEGYALIKRLTQKNTHQQLGITVSKAASETAALMVFENMAKVARRNLSVRLAYLGMIPIDTRMQRAGDLPSTASMHAYLQLSQKLLSLPMQQDDTDVHKIVRNPQRHTDFTAAMMR
jgi:flagellar biosynthesis protein FlhG